MFITPPKVKRVSFRDSSALNECIRDNWQCFIPIQSELLFTLCYVNESIEVFTNRSSSLINNTGLIKKIKDSCSEDVANFVKACDNTGVSPLFSFHDYKLTFVCFINDDSSPANISKINSFDFSVSKEFIWLNNEDGYRDNSADIEAIESIASQLQGDYNYFALFSDSGFVYVFDSPLNESYNLMSSIGASYLNVLNYFDNSTFIESICELLNDESLVSVVEFWINAIDSLIRIVLYHIKEINKNKSLIDHSSTRDNLFFPIINKCVHFEYEDDKCFDEILSFIRRKYDTESKAKTLITNAVEALVGLD